ncbi:MAG: UvrD-helicase domain-containing protein, partial [Bacteroidota bacterium]
MPPVIHDDFDAVEVPLQEINLIEASAGTGKTYSIAILALRLVLEKNIPIEKILMVTFTRDAAAEMEIRVRAFIRVALMYARTGKIEDPTIKKIVDDFSDNEKAIERLQKALLSFDKASIFTIHGFCARILKEFSFECGQRFKAAAMEPDVLE